MPRHAKRIRSPRSRRRKLGIQILIAVDTMTVAPVGICDGSWPINTVAPSARRAATRRVLCIGSRTLTPRHQHPCDPRHACATDTHDVHRTEGGKVDSSDFRHVTSRPSPLPRPVRSGLRASRPHRGHPDRQPPGPFSPIVADLAATAAYPRLNPGKLVVRQNARRQH